MKNKGFTLVELLAVIVVLGIIMVIATTSVSKSLEESRKRAKFIAAEEITEIAAAYIETETDGVSTSGDGTCVSVHQLKNKEYLESDVTNPETSKNDAINDSHLVCKNSPLTCNEDAREEYDVCEDGNIKFYRFGEYVYQYTFDE